MKRKLLTLVMVVFVAFSMNAQLLVDEGFEGGVFPAGWTLESVEHEWVATDNTNIGANTGDWFLASYYSPSTSAKDDWFFTPGLSMEAGTTYPINFYVKGEGWGGVAESIELMVGTGAASTDMTDVLWDSPDVAYVDWTLVTIDYVCATTGTYYFGWHAYSAADLNYIGIDDIAIGTPPTYDVTFNVDMNAPITAGTFVAGTDVVYIAGFPAWDEPGTNAALEMLDGDADGIYTIAFTDVLAGDYAYKFFQNAGWAGGEWNGGADRFFSVTDAAVTLDNVWANRYGGLMVSTIAELRAVALDELVELTGEAILTFQQANRNQKWIEDATGAILIDDDGGVITTVYDQYDGITGIAGTLSAYNDLLQFIPYANSFDATSTANTLTPQTVDIATLLAGVSDYESELVTVVGATFDDADGTVVFETGTNYGLTDASGSFNFRTNYYDADYITTVIPEYSANITGMVGNYQGTAQLTARDLADIADNTAINEINNNISIYPNPSNGVFNITVENSLNLEVLDITGKLINTRTLNGTTTLELNTSGVYFLRFSNENGAVTQRVIVQ